MVHRHGFTLVELLVVITIILAISVVTLPTVVNALAERQVGEAARILQASIAGARDRAIHANAPAGLRFLPSPADPNMLVTIQPMESAPSYAEGAVNTFPLEVYPTTITGGKPCLILEQSPGHWIESGGKWLFLPNPPTSWAWNIRVGDHVTLGAGQSLTVCGPVATPNADFFVSGNTFPRTFTAPDGITVATGVVEYLQLVNGLDDNNDGFVDNGWDGIDNDHANGIDELAEWEAESWSTGPVRNAAYAIVRRPAPSKGQTISLSAGIDLSRSTLPVSPLDGSVEVMIRPDGSASLASLYATPSEPRIVQDGKAVPPALSFVLGTPGDHRTITLWPKTGLIESLD